MTQTGPLRRTRDDRVLAWEKYFRENNTVLEYLKTKGLTLAEALLVLETAHSAEHLHELSRDLFELSQRLDQLISTLPPPDEGDEWKSRPR